MRRPLLPALLLLGLPFATLANPLAPEVAGIRDALRGRDIDTALALSEKVVVQRAADPHAWYWAGNAYSNKALQASLLAKPKWAGRTREAWETAIRLEPRLFDAHFNLIQYYLVAPGVLGGGRGKADQRAAEIARLDPSMGKVAQGMLAQYDKDRARSELAFRDALTLDPANERALLALGSLLQAAERWEEAKALWRERLEQAADDPLAHYQLGRLAALRGEDLDAGLAHLDAFLAADVVPESLSVAAAHWRRGNVLEKLGRTDEARAAYRLALADPTVRESAQNDLDRLGG